MRVRNADSTGRWVGGYPAGTAQDWVTYGDYLIELTAVSETTLDPDASGTGRGEGLFRRVFTLMVDRVLWSRPGVTQQPPTTVEWTSGGWQFKDGKTPTEAARLLAQTPPDPQARPYLDLNAIDRYQAVAADHEATASPR